VTYLSFDGLFATILLFIVLYPNTPEGGGGGGMFGVEKAGGWFVSINKSFR
jgi:hypothetical protein